MNLSRKAIQSISAGFLLAACLLFSACSSSEQDKISPDFSVVLTETRGLQADAPVLWQGQPVGTVIRMEPDKEGFRADVLLADHLRNHFHDDLTARAIGNVNRPAQTTLNLYGGTDTRRPKLASGQLVPEALPHATLSQAQIYWIAAGIGALVIVILLVKTITFVMKLGLALALVALGFFYFNVVWERHGQDLIPESVSARIDQFLATHEVPEHLDEWMVGIKADLHVATNRVTAHGREAGNTMVQSVKDRVREKIEEAGETSEAGRMLKEFLDQL
ncbi:MAG: hypothetical protein JJU29_01885 [Verrucomicrobia bacterium]|nr:hypothetical protein [Verrucomicrobiota bacterium]MCH8510984.1 MCE family protein [Kiritimatiellia bacterium]